MKWKWPVLSLIAMAMALSAAPSAGAATLTSVGGQIAWHADNVPGRSHSVDVDFSSPIIIGPGGSPAYFISVVSPEATTPVAPCAATTTAGVFRCPAEGVTRVEVLTYTGNDTVTTDANDNSCAVIILCLDGAVSVPMTVQTRAGNDVIRAGGGADLLLGEGDNDTIRPGAGADDVRGGTGTDTVEHLDRSAVTVALTGGVPSGPDADDTGSGIENVTGSSGADVLTGDASPNVLSGSGSADQLFGGDGSDTLIGGDGDDVLDGQAGTFDSLNGENGVDTADFASRGAAVTVSLNSGCDDGVAGENDCVTAERVVGTVGNDTLTGSVAEESFHGGGGADAIDGGAGADTVEYSGRAEGVAVSLEGGVGDDGGPEDGAPGARDTVTAVEHAVGGDGPDLLDGSSVPNVLTGGAGDDVLIGRGGTDALRGGGGTDSADYRDKAAGQPVVLSLDGAANDGEPGENDAFDGIEIAAGGSGADRLSATAVGAELRGGIGDDALFAPNGGGTLRGGFGNDTLTGGDGADQLFGDDGDDTLEARDGVADGLDCGQGFDTALTDPLDARASCEAGGTDADRDGFIPPQDCDDTNAGVRPNVPEIPGNRADENCDGRVAPFALPANLKVPVAWERFRGYTRLIKLQVTGLRKGATVRLTCAKIKGKGKGPGCPFAAKRLKVSKGKANGTKLFRKARLRTGAVLQIRIATPGHLALIRTLRFKNAESPRTTDRCQAPGAKKTQRCR